MPASPQDLFAFLDQLNIAHETVAHKATFTVAEGRDLKATLPGGHSKNLFMKDKNGALVLVSAWADNTLKLNALHRRIGTRRLSFTDGDMLLNVLGVPPGSVTPFALMNDQPATVRFLVDLKLVEHERVNFHPLVNTATTGIKSADLQRFVEATGHRYEIVDFSDLT